ASSSPTLRVGMGVGYNNICGWIWNPWYGVYTYVPCNGIMYSPYGYRYWSPYTVGTVYRPPTYNNPVNTGFGGGGFGNVPYNTAPASSIGSSGTVNSSPSVSAAPSSSMGSTSSAASSSSSAGHGA